MGANRGQFNKVPGSITHIRVHARGIDAKGKVAPRCDAFRGSHCRDDLRVTNDLARVTCEKCLAVAV